MEQLEEVSTGFVTRGSASNQVLVKEVVERINKMNNNKLSFVDWMVFAQKL